MRDFEGVVAVYEAEGGEFRFVDFALEDRGVRVVEFPGLTRAGENVLVAEVWEPWLQGGKRPVDHRGRDWARAGPLAGALHRATWGRGVGPPSLDARGAG